MQFEGISVVVPVYNGRQSLERLVDGLEEVLLQCTDDFEIILVNDGSKDNSWQIIEKLVEARKTVRGLT